MSDGRSEQRGLTLGRTIWKIYKKNCWVFVDCAWDAPVSRVVFPSPYFHESWILRGLGLVGGSVEWSTVGTSLGPVLACITSSSVWLSCGLCGFMFYFLQWWWLLIWKSKLVCCNNNNNNYYYYYNNNINNNHNNEIQFLIFWSASSTAQGKLYSYRKIYKFNRTNLQNTLTSTGPILELVNIFRINTI